MDEVVVHETIYFIFDACSTSSGSRGGLICAAIDNLM